MGQVIQITDMVRKLDNPPNRIREVRTAKRKTLQNVADATGSAKHTIARFETGERDASLEWLKLIARALGVTVGDLLNPEDNPYLPADEDEAAIAEATRRADPANKRAIRGVAETLTTFEPAPAKLA